MIFIPLLNAHDMSLHYRFVNPLLNQKIFETKNGKTLFSLGVLLFTLARDREIKTSCHSRIHH